MPKIKFACLCRGDCPPYKVLWEAGLCAGRLAYAEVASRRQASSNLSNRISIRLLSFVKPYLTLNITTLLFFALPLSVLLSATGSFSPLPIIVNLVLEIPFEIK